MVTTSNVGKFSPATIALIQAVRKNQPNNAKASIKRGGNVNVVLGSGNTLLHICLDEVMGSILLKAGAKIDARNPLNQTPLHTSMRRSLIPLTLLLINNGANLNAQELDGTAPLHLAEADVIVAALLSKGANPNIQNVSGDTPLLLAIRYKGSPVVSALVNGGADKNIANNAHHDAYIEYDLLYQQRLGELTRVAAAVFGPALQHNTQQAAPSKASLPAFELAKKAHTSIPTAAPDHSQSTTQQKRRLEH